MASQSMAPPSGSGSMAPRHRSSRSTSSSSDCEGLRAGTERRSSGSDSCGGDKKTWLGSVKTWLSVSEPSAQAMRTQKREAFRKHGVNPKDPAAAAKMHLPLGTLPPGTTTSTSGPTPEKRLARELQDRPQYRKHGSTQSVSSGGSSIAPSIREINQVAPWEN
ncbi:hypothetical protein V2A60_000892 [Cordyceps javanica]|uniref:Uncharacterized protein n=1 Tax=Cordyceps javanica TaxID=43265 RepID=A0A545V1X0_9HYPO|nr:hypothetical protein IF1G_05538 [Cordyceps javanica]TQW07087.1 hypothetical protein IF2G_05471 [Cordyceps javanica]